MGARHIESHSRATQNSAFRLTAECASFQEVWEWRGTTCRGSGGRITLTGPPIDRMRLGIESHRAAAIHIRNNKPKTVRAEAAFIAAFAFQKLFKPWKAFKAAVK